MMALGSPRDTQRWTYARGQALLAGETVTSGRYVCRECGQARVVEDGKVVSLPVCPRCQNDTWDLA